METWQMAGLCGLGFILHHFILSHHPLRTRLSAAMGANTFLGLYTVSSGLLYLPLCWWWWWEPLGGPLLYTTRATPVALLGGAIVGLGIVLMVGGLVKPSRAGFAIRMLDKGRTPKAFVALGRHPVFHGLALFSLGHLIIDGSAMAFAFHGTHIVLGFGGTLHQDQRLVRDDPAYAEFMARTRFFPLPWPTPRSEFGSFGWAGLAAGLTLAIVARMLLHP